MARAPDLIRGRFVLAGGDVRGNRPGPARRARRSSASP